MASVVQKKRKEKSSPPLSSSISSLSYSCHFVLDFVN